MANPPSTAKLAVLVTAMLLLGSHNTINMKLCFQTCAPSSAPIAHTTHRGDSNICPEGEMIFQGAWLNNFVMFVGEASVLIFYGISRRRKMREARALAAGSTNVDSAGLVAAAPAASAVSNFVFAIPATCDVVGSGLACVGMLYMDGAIWQMLRSAIIVFSAILSVLFLKRRLHPFHWVAVGIILFGLLFVGYASTLDSGSDGASKKSSGEQLFGISLVVGAQLVSAFQMVFEEKLVSGTGTTAKKVVGMEGVFGMTGMAILLFIFTMVPGSDPSQKGSYENFPLNVSQVFESGQLLVLNLLFMLSIAGYNVLGITVAKHLSSVVRCLVDSCRTIVVWVVNLLIFYTVSEKYGAPWKEHDWMTAIGFVILVCGTLLYNEVLPAPACLKYETQAGEEDLPRLMSGLDDVLAKARVGVADEDEGTPVTGHTRSLETSDVVQAH